MVSIFREKYSKEKMLLITMFICIGIFGFISGLFFEQTLPVPPNPILLTEDSNPYVPSLRIHAIDEMTAAFTTGTHGIDISVHDEVYHTAPHSTYTVSTNPLHEEEELSTLIPTSLNEPCIFIASTSGKYAYHYTEPKGQKLKTKRCFSSEEDVLANDLTIYEP